MPYYESMLTLNYETVANDQAKLEVTKKGIAVLLLLLLTSCYSIKSSIINKLDEKLPRSKYTIERLEKLKDSLSKRWQKIDQSF